MLFLINESLFVVFHSGRYGLRERETGKEREREKERVYELAID